jgi:hypothetical protein
MTNATSTQLQELYVAYFGRAADPPGLDYWTESGISTAQFAADMYAQAEFADAYGDLSTESQVNQIYKNLFDREADVAGLTYWTQQINLGNLQLAEIANDLIWAAQNNSGSSDDKTALENRTAAAVAYTAEVKSTTAGILAYQAESTSPWKSGVNLTEAKTYLSGIDKDTASTAAGITASVAVITANGVPAASVAGKTFALTKNIDAGSSFTGDTGNDTFSGSAGTIDGDILDGGAGTDTLSISVTNADDNNSSFKSSNIENVSIRTTTSSAVVLDLGDVTGMTKLTSRRLAGNLQLDNVDYGSAVQIDDTSTGKLVDVNFSAASVTGSSDKATVTLDTNTDVDLDVDSIETLTLNTVTGASVIGALTGDAIATINVTGDKKLTVSSITGAGDLTVDASAATGGSAFTFGTGDHTFTGGSGADTISTGITLTANDSIDGGAGSDTLVVKNVDSALTVIPLKADVSNVETLRIEATDDSGADAFTLNASTVKFTNIIIDASDEADTYTFTKVTDENISLTESANNAIDLIDVSLTDATGTSDSLTLKVTNADATTALTVDDINSTGGGIETLTLNLVQGKDIASASDIIVDDISSSHTTLNIEGNADATIGGTTAVSPKTIDGSTSTGDLTIELAAAAHTVTTGSGADNVDFNSTLGSTDTYDGGAGSDTLTATMVAGTHTPTVKNVEKLKLAYTAASSYNASKTTGATEVYVLGASDNNLTVTNMPATVVTTYLSPTATDASDTVTLNYVSGADSAHTVKIGDTADTADVDTSDITITNNKGALTITSEGADGNLVDDIHANTADALTISTEIALSIDTANSGGGALNATSALSFTATTAGGSLIVDGATDVSKATTIDLDATNGLMTLTGATTATKATSIDVNAKGYAFLQTGNFVSDADVATLNLTSASKSGSIIFDGVLDVDHATAMTFTASDGATVRVDDLELIGKDSASTAADVDTTLTLSATGTDVDGNGTTMTIGGINSASNTTATLDTVTITSDAKATVSFTTGSSGLTITTIDASASLGTNTFTTTSTAAAVDLTLGAAKKNTFTAENNLADKVTLAVGAGEDVIKVVDDTTACDQITNFEAGDGGDTVQIDASELVGGALENFNSVEIDSSLAVAFGTDADGTLVNADDAVLANDNILVLTDTFANVAAVYGALDLDAETLLGNLASGDACLVLWTNGSDTFLSTATSNAADGISYNAGADLVQFMNTTVTDFTADNFEFL